MYNAAGNRTLCRPNPIIMYMIGKSLSSNQIISHHKLDDKKNNRTKILNPKLDLLLIFKEKLNIK